MVAALYESVMDDVRMDNGSVELDQHCLWQVFCWALFVMDRMLRSL